MTAIKLPSLPEPDWLHLKPFGYAPGHYMNRCRWCNKTVDDVDKMARCCRPCAEKLHAHAAAVTAAKDAEIAQLRQYLDTAQRRAAALGDEVAGLREAQIDYTVLHGFADKHRISYNELCVAVRAALAARKGEAKRLPPSPSPRS